MQVKKLYSRASLDTAKERAYARAANFLSGEAIRMPAVEESGMRHRGAEKFLSVKTVRGLIGFGLFLVLALSAAASGRAAEEYAVVLERNVPAKMRDGVTLKADVYRPKADGKFPVLLVRTPYDKVNESGFGMKGAARGYVVI